MIYPALTKLAESASPELKKFAAEIESYFREVREAGGFVTAEKLTQSGITLVPDITYHQESVQGVSTPGRTAPVVVGIDISEELYATLTPGVYKSRLLVSWAAMGAAVVGYEIELFIEGALLQKGNTAHTLCRFDNLDPGLYTIRIRSLFACNQDQSKWQSVDVEVLGEKAKPHPPGNVSVAIYPGSSELRIVWTESVDADVVGYIIHQGLSWENSIEIGRVGKTTEYAWRPNVVGDNLRFWIKSIDSLLQESESARGNDSILTVSGPVMPATALSAEVLDNNVLLKWQRAEQGTYPIDYYEIVKGFDPNAPTVEFGRQYGTFATVFEAQTGQYKYWVRAVDTTGLLKSEWSGAYATVTAPDNFDLYDVLPSTLGGTKTNCIITNLNTLVVPVNTSLSWNDHFQNNPDTTLEPWATPAEQIADGFPLFIQPGPGTASYEEIVAYVDDVAPTLTYKITLDVSRVTLAGTVDVTPTIKVRALSSDPWIDLGNVYEILPPAGYRQVLYRLDFATPDNGLCEITRLQYNLVTKRKKYAGTIQANAGDAGGTIVYITNDKTATGTPIFVDVISIVVTPQSVSSIKAVWDIGTEASPTHFHIFAFNDSGVRETCPVGFYLEGV